jgi:hypothetical protein
MEVPPGLRLRNSRIVHGSTVLFYGVLQAWTSLLVRGHCILDAPIDRILCGDGAPFLPLKVAVSQFPAFASQR